MERPPEHRYALLIESRVPTEVAAVHDALRAGRIPYQSGLLPGEPPQVLFYVPDSRLVEARDAVSEWLQSEAQRSRDALRRDEGAEDPEPDEDDSGPAVFPWEALTLVSSVALVNFAVVFGNTVGLGAGRTLSRLGALTHAAVAGEPWRLVTSLFLHSGPSHAGWNAVSMLVFGVPLVVDLGAWRTAAIYLAAGIGGGLTALWYLPEQGAVIGSSGAVAGLFGAWVASRWIAARRSAFGWRRRVRALGIALLFVPSLLNPLTSDGRPISVSSHLGGLATGMALGALLALGLGRPRGEDRARFTASNRD